MAPETARAALEALWACMVELAEAGHDQVVTSQVRADQASADEIERIAADLATLAGAAVCLARVSP